jgi:hypothetical protein
MSYSGLSANQAVTLNNLKDAVTTGVFTANTTIPSGNKLITKSEAATYVNCSTSYGPFAAKSSNQLVVKSDLVGRVTVNFTFNLDASNSGSMDIYTASPAGSGWTLSQTLTSNGATFNPSLLVGDAFYVTVTHTARASGGQRGQIVTYINGSSTSVNTTSGSLPKSISSSSTTLAVSTTYSVTGLCGDLI